MIRFTFTGYERRPGSVPDRHVHFDTLYDLVEYIWANANQRTDVAAAHAKTDSVAGVFLAFLMCREAGLPFSLGQVLALAGFDGATIEIHEHALLDINDEHLPAIIELGGLQDGEFTRHLVKPRRKAGEKPFGPSLLQNAELLSLLRTFGRFTPTREDADDEAESQERAGDERADAAARGERGEDRVDLGGG